ncbi:hypothetical protein EJ110_NYTH57754 [Nymphaea thermarum]|nr:hypothetical protein EJ110_NYTH57754 [Nymphaea thermarum]
MAWQGRIIRRWCVLHHKAKISVNGYGAPQLPIHDRLKKVGFQFPSRCPLCFTNGEDILHLFYLCKFAYNTWSKVVGKFNRKRLPHANVSQEFKKRFPTSFKNDPIPYDAIISLKKEAILNDKIFTNKSFTSSVWAACTENILSIFWKAQTKEVGLWIKHGIITFPSFPAISQGAIIYMLNVTFGERVVVGVMHNCAGQYRDRVEVYRNEEDHQMPEMRILEELLQSFSADFMEFAVMSNNVGWKKLLKQGLEGKSNVLRQFPMLSSRIYNATMLDEDLPSHKVDKILFLCKEL